MPQIGTVKLQTQNSGTVDVPVYDTGDSSLEIYEMVRVQTDTGTGFIPVVSAGSAAHPYLRIKTENHGTVAAHDKPFTREILDDFNDGNATIDAANWSGWTKIEDEGTGYVNALTTTEYEGSGALKIKTDTPDSTTDTNIRAIAERDTDIKPSGVGFAHHVESRSKEQYTNVYIESNANIGDVSNEIAEFSSKGNSWNEYRLHFDWPNREYERYDITNDTYDGTFSFNSSSGGFGAVELEVLTRTNKDIRMHFDYLYKVP